MKRYLVFAFDFYYPIGGWDDFKKDFDTTTEALDYISANLKEYDDQQIVDTKTKEII